MTTKVHIHEDDEGMRLLYPATARDEVEEDLDAAEKASVENRAPNGIGWTDVHRIKEPESTYASIGASLDEVAAAVGQHLPRIEVFEVGFGEGNPFHYRDVGGHTYGFGRHLYVRFDTKDDALLGIWYDVATSDNTELAALRSAFLDIDKVQPSMIADYWLGVGGLVRDTAFIDGYFATIADRSSPAPPSGSQEEARRSSWLSIFNWLFGR